jgi:Tfp pilus assembly protein PilO
MFVLNAYKKYLVTTGLVWSASFVIFLFIYMLVLAPQKDHKKYLDRELVDKRQVYESALQTSKKEIRIKLNEQVESLRDRLGDFVIDFEDSTNLTFDISQVANEQKVTSFSIKSKNSRGLSEIPDCKYISENFMDINFNGGFHQFATFLNALERHRPVLFVNSFTITTSQQDNLNYQVSINVAALVRKQQESKTADKVSSKNYSKKI